MPGHVVVDHPWRASEPQPEPAARKAPCLDCGRPGGVHLYRATPTSVRARAFRLHGLRAHWDIFDRL